MKTQRIFTLDCGSGGVSFGEFHGDPNLDPREYTFLRAQADTGIVPLRSRYAVDKTAALPQLEGALRKLSERGILSECAVYFGVLDDPFHPFEGKFTLSLKVLSLFERYRPGALYVQTRSPLAVIALPALQKLKPIVQVVCGIESNQEAVLRKLTPHYPKLSERIKTMTVFRRFGVSVGIQVAPLLPYGRWREDAVAFAEFLDEQADTIFVRPLFDGSPRSERETRKNPLARRLADERLFHWLRKDAAQPLLNALAARCEKKLMQPEVHSISKNQLQLFG